VDNDEYNIQTNITCRFRVRGLKLIKRKKSEKLLDLLGLQQVSLMIKKSRLRWFGHVEWKYDNDWVKRCI